MQQGATFNCPTCGAALSSNGGVSEVKCSYCNSTVIVPEALRKGKTDAQGRVYIGEETAQNLVIDMIRNPNKYSGASTQQAQPQPYQIPTTSVVFGDMSTMGMTTRRSSGSGCSTVIGFMVIMLSVVAIIGAVLWSTFGKISIPGLPSIPGLSSDITPTIISFGTKGTGPGAFQDARYIGTDSKGNIYVGEFTSARIQKFDATGTFIKSWIVEGDKKIPLVSMVVARDGKVYAVRAGGIYVYDGETTELLKTIKSAGMYYDDVYALPDGGLLAHEGSIDDSVVKLDANGKVVKQFDQPIAQATDDTELNVKVASDGLGNFYLVGSFTYSVYKYTPDGKFVNKFGGKAENHEPGLFTSTGDIAVDNKGRVYVGDIFGINVFDSNGRFLKFLKFEPGTIIYGISFTDKGELLLASNTKVGKYQINIDDSAKR